MDRDISENGPRPKKLKLSKEGGKEDKEGEAYQKVNDINLFIKFDKN